MKFRGTSGREYEVTDPLVIDDAMVLRVSQFLAKRGLCFLAPGDPDIRTLLEAALTPPAEPEVVVTDTMVKAGVTAVYDRPEAEPDRGYMAGSVERVYRAMQAARPKPVEPPEHKHSWSWTGAGGGGSGPSTLHENCHCGATRITSVPRRAEDRMRDV